jgi:hypothetical protein
MSIERKAQGETMIKVFRSIRKGALKMKTPCRTVCFASQGKRKIMPIEIEKITNDKIVSNFFKKRARLFSFSICIDTPNPSIQDKCKK